MENKEYKSLGNAIREAVFNRKNAPTMLPDSTVDKLGLNEEDILYIEVDEEDVLEPMDEARARRMGDRQPPKDQDSYYTKQRAEKMAKELARALNDLSVPDSDSVVYEYRGRKRGRDYKKENAQARKQLEQIISQIEGVSKLVGKVVNKWNQSKP